MEDIYVHQHIKGELNPFRDSTVFGTNAHTHSPLHKLYFYHKSMHFKLVYVSVYIYIWTLNKGQTKIS